MGARNIPPLAKGVAMKREELPTPTPPTQRKQPAQLPPPLAIGPTSPHTRTPSSSTTGAATCSLPPLPPPPARSPSHFLTLKFVFRTTRNQRAKASRRATIHRWFDARSIETSCEGQEGRIRGLVETVGFIRDIMREEAKIVGSRENVVLGGLS